MANNLIITVSRQFGSGGHQIGERLASALDVSLFDKTTIAQAAKEYGLYEQVMNDNEQAATNSLLFSIAANLHPLSQDGIPFEEWVLMAEEKAMRTLSKEGSCIFIGRAADTIFRSSPQRISFFIHAPIDWRAQHVADHYDIPLAKAKTLTRQMDKKRASYYARRSEFKWGDAQTYHLSIDSSVLGLDATAEQLLRFIHARK